MNREARERGRRSAAVRAAACERIIAAIDDIETVIRGQTQADFFAEDFDARTRRKACELDVVRIANDVAEAGIEDDLPTLARDGLRKQRSIAAHSYVAMDPDMLWRGLHGLDEVKRAAEAALRALGA